MNKRSTQMLLSKQTDFYIHQILYIYLIILLEDLLEVIRSEKMCKIFIQSLQ